MKSDEVNISQIALKNDGATKNAVTTKNANVFKDF